MNEPIPDTNMTDAISSVTEGLAVKDKLNIMLDLETLGTKPGCKILSISAVTFDTENDIANYFDIFISMATQDLLVTDPATWDWWMTQDERVRLQLFDSPRAVTLVKALGYFSDWIDSLNCIPVIWAKGATFDPPVLEAAYNAYKMPVPWEFRNVRCHRTLEDTFGHLVERPEQFGDKHRGLHDAINQAKYATAILQCILPHTYPDHD